MSVSHIAEQLQSLELAYGSSAEVEITIGENNQSACKYLQSGILSSCSRFMRRIVRFLAASLGLASHPPAEHVNTRALASIFGQERIEAACGLHPPETVSDIRRLFAKLATPTLSDLEKILQDGEYDFSLENASSEELQLLYDQAAPFKSLHELFLSTIPPIDRPPVDSGKTRYGDELKTRVLYELTHNDQMTHDQWVTLIAKQLAPLEVEPGTLIKGYDGTWYTVHSTIGAGGSYATLLKVVGENRENRPAIVLYRGTHPTPIACEGFEGVIEDIRKGIGTRGLIESYDQLNRLLHDPAAGFIQPGQPVWAMGMSLGGTHAQRLAILFPDVVRRVSLVASPGIDRSSCELYQEVLQDLAEREEVEAEEEICPRLIELLLDADDITDSMGEMHLGAGCSEELVALRVALYDAEPSRGIDAAINERRMPASFYPAAAAVKFFTALSTAHIALTAWKPHKRVVWNNRAQEVSETEQEESGGAPQRLSIQDIFSHSDRFYDASWERLRQRVTLSGIKKYFFPNSTEDGVDENVFVNFARSKLR